MCIKAARSNLLQPIPSRDKNVSNRISLSSLPRSKVPWIWDPTSWHVVAPTWCIVSFETAARRTSHVVRELYRSHTCTCKQWSCPNVHWMLSRQDNPQRQLQQPSRVPCASKRKIQDSISEFALLQIPDSTSLHQESSSLDQTDKQTHRNDQHNKEQLGQGSRLCVDMTTPLSY